MHFKCYQQKRNIYDISPEIKSKRSEHPGPVPSPHHYSEEHSCFYLSVNKVDVILKLHLREDSDVCPRTIKLQHRANVLHLLPFSDSLWCNSHQVQPNCPDCSKPVKPVDTAFNCKGSIFYNLWIKSPPLCCVPGERTGLRSRLPCYLSPGATARLKHSYRPAAKRLNNSYLRLISDVAVKEVEGGQRGNVNMLPGDFNLVK